MARGGRGLAARVADADGHGDLSPRGPSPTARRVQGARWRDPRLLVGVLLVAGCALVGARLAAAADDTVGVWAARVTLPEGRPVPVEDLVTRRVRFSDRADADRYLPASEPPPTGVTTARPVGAGELLPRAALNLDGAGTTTQVPLAVGAEAVPATVRVGSVVDVWVTPGAGAPGGTSPGAGGAPSRRSVLVFDHVAVVAVPPSGSSLGPTSTRQVIVGVPPVAARGLPTAIAALSSGAVLLTVPR
ncbi:MAG: hypothetical protein WB441_05265 [Nocardioidaceae bacterium]